MIYIYDLSTRQEHVSIGIRIIGVLPEPFTIRSNVLVSVVPTVLQDVVVPFLLYVSLSMSLCDYVSPVLGHVCMCVVCVAT